MAKKYIRQRRTKGESTISSLKSSEKWKIMDWMWEEFPKCPDIDNVVDVDAVEGTMTLTSSSGNEYTITMKRGNWREI